MKHILAVCLAASLTMTYAQNMLTPELLWQMGRVSLEDVSPDGRMVIYGVTRYDVPANKGKTDLWVVSSDGGPARQLTGGDGSKGNARYRPDGQRIGYLVDGIMHEMKPDGSDIKKVSDIEMGGFIYAPTGNKVLYIADIKYLETPQDRYPDLPLAKARITDDLMYRHWKSWDDYMRSNIFIADYANGVLTSEPVNIMKDEPFDAPLAPMGGIEQMAWSPDGKFVAYTSKKMNGKEAALSTNSNVYIYDVTTKRTRNVSIANEGYDIEPTFSADGKYVAWLSMARNGYEADKNRIMVYELAAGNKVDITADFAYDAASLRWAADNKTLYFIAAEQGTHPIYEVDVTNKKFRKIAGTLHDYNGLAVGNNCLVATRMSMRQPTELVRVDLKNGDTKTLDDPNAALLKSISLGEVRKRTVKTTDGKDMLVWMILPPNFDPAKKYPTLLYCQGGPQSMVSQFWSYRWNMQLMAANGYIVVAPCRRGMPGFGAQWNEQISGDWGGQAMNDLLSAIDDAATEPFVDRTRLAAVGASFGGFSVYWLAGNHQKRFKTFIAHCGMFNMESWYGTTEEMWFANWDTKGPYWENPSSFDRFSPHHFVKNWDTPLLVIHCEKDFRVPIGEGMQAYQAAQLKGIKSRFLYFEDEGHWVTKPQNSILWQREYFRWLKETL